MKNKHILNLHKEVPALVRLEVYKEALDSIINNTKVSGMLSHGLCLILPCLMWGLSNPSDLSPDGNIWDYKDTQIAFPELSKEVLKKLGNSLEEENKNILRIKYLKKFIKKLENDILR